MAFQVQRYHLLNDNNSNNTNTKLDNENENLLLFHLVSIRRLP
jgi:hypothetical protein